jgi:hypothetical protein
MGKNQEPESGMRDKHPRSATLPKCLRNCTVLISDPDQPSLNVDGAL